MAERRKRWTWYEKVAAELALRGWSGAELARRIGEGPEKVRKWLSGKHAPIEGAVAKIAEALGWSEAFLRHPTKDPKDWAFEERLEDLLAALSPEEQQALKRALRDPRMRRALVAYGAALGAEEPQGPPGGPSSERR